MASEPDKTSRRKKIDQWIGRMAMKALSRMARAMPEAWALKLGAGVGVFVYHLLPRYRNVSIRNLTQVFGDEWTPERIERTARDVFRHIGMNLMEFLRFPSMRPEHLDEMVRVEGEEHAREALRRGKGVLAITSHYGNFELFGATFVHKGYPISVIARSADDEETNNLINGIRERMGYHVFPRKNAARQSIATLKRNEILGVLPDQNDVDGIFVPFFGRPAATAIGPAYMALHTGAAILPAFIHREPDNTHVVKIFPPLEYEPTGDRAADLYNLTLAINQAIERAIREHPEQWFWLHNRWKKRPPEEAARLAPDYEGAELKGGAGASAP
jgi:KDO2-lipid IV(A) lauroyltransferase